MGKNYNGLWSHLFVFVCGYSRGFIIIITARSKDRGNGRVELTAAGEI
ncbi:MAG: hypothetical protein IPH11_00610 [Ignavibacteriales bacterium]|nr:hypothetical protein [Ignavibacteriales bacterium]